MQQVSWRDAPREPNEYWGPTPAVRHAASMRARAQLFEGVVYEC
jgi:hypothetical protein